MREQAEIPTLRNRREVLADKFALKCRSNPRFSHWFPLKSTRSSNRQAKKTKEYLEEKARCKRLYDSPIFYFRRRLNGKPGKEYGKRYEEYRKA